MRIKGLLRGLVLCLAPLVVCVSAADYVAIAHVIYDGGNTIYYADNESNFKYHSLTRGEDDMFTIEFKQERLEGSDREGRETVRQLRFGLGCNEGSCKTNLNEGHEPYLAELFPDYQNGVDSQAIAEVWIIINDDSTLTISPTKLDIPVSQKKVIRFLAPWSNTNALLYVNGSESYMSSVPNYCGWFEAKITPPKGEFYVYFKQTIGGTSVGIEGPTKEEISPDQEISLDSIAALTDTIWVQGFQFGSPELFSEYPEVLGDCPIKNLPVMMFDWYDGTVNSDGTKDAYEEWQRKKGAGRTGFDVRGVPMYGEGTSQDFGKSGCEADPMTGMVEKELGANGVPVRASNFPSNCTNATHLNDWFLPEVLAKDDAGNEYTNVTCREIPLSLTDEGFWYAQIDDESPEQGLFLLDDFRYLDSAGTIENPHYDSLYAGSGRGYHNFGFAMKIQATFQYVKGQYFEFNGDDDVWVFIDNKLVVDIGGQHKKVKKSVNLDKLGLEEDSTYNFHIFYAERKREASNFMMKTSIDLHVESSMLLTDISDDPKIIKKEVWQIIRERKLACDFSSTPELEHTERGPSNFVLFGRSLSGKGVALNILDSLYYNGITIGNDFTMITIDPKAITKAKALPPGTYFVRVSLKTNPNDFKDVYFTVDPYEFPNIAFSGVKDSSYCILNIESEDETDSLCFDKYWYPYGSLLENDSMVFNVSSDTLPLNLNKNEKMWAGRSYPVSIMYAEEWASIYSGIKVEIKTSDTLLIACDSMGNPITEVVLDSGKANFFVRGTGEIVNATLTISSISSKNKQALWTQINMKEPPVPQIESAYIYDRNGDGRSDSIWIHFNKPLSDSSVLDSLKFVFGINDSAYTLPKNNSFNKVTYKIGEDVATIVAAKNCFGRGIFTGGASSPYSGKLNIWYTYTDPEDKSTAVFPVEGQLTDKVGPVITAAEISISDDGNTQLQLTFSEGINKEGANVDFFRFRNNSATSQLSNLIQPAHIATSSANQWTLIYVKGSVHDVVPTVGDSIRFTPPSIGGLALDLVNVPPHELNPWARITGEQSVRITSPTVVVLDRHSDVFVSASAIVRSESATVPKLVSGEQKLTAQQVAAIYGTQGHYLGDLDMGSLVRNEIAEIVKAVQGKTTYTDKEAVENGDPHDTYTLEEILNAVSAGKLSIDDAQDRLGLPDIIVDAYENGLLTKENLRYYESGSEADIEQIAVTVADNTELWYRATYYTSLGHFVNRDEGTIRCTDDIFKADGASDCLENNGRFFLAWNMRSSGGRLAATGIYIARLEIKISVNSNTISKQARDFLWGVRRGNVNAMDFGL